MSAKSTLSSSVALESDSEPECLPPLENRVVNLAQHCLAYAAAAKIQHFRYCPRSAVGFSEYSLDEAIAELESECRNLADSPVCQSLAFELLASLAGLAHCPPCRNRREQQAIAKIVHTALLELR